MPAIRDLDHVRESLRNRLALAAAAIARDDGGQANLPLSLARDRAKG
jgi:hypothetical protein